MKYGYDPRKSKSKRGRDGIFDVSENYKPKNEMVKKLYDRYLHTEKGFKELSHYLENPSCAQGVRVVSHKLRLLGFIRTEINAKILYKLVLTDVDLNRR